MIKHEIEAQLLLQIQTLKAQLQDAKERLQAAGLRTAERRQEAEAQGEERPREDEVEWLEARLSAAEYHIAVLCRILFNQNFMNLKQKYPDLALHYDHQFIRMMILQMGGSQEICTAQDQMKHMAPKDSVPQRKDDDSR